MPGSSSGITSRPPIQQANVIDDAKPARPLLPGTSPKAESAPFDLKRECELLRHLAGKVIQDDDGAHRSFKDSYTQVTTHIKQQDETVGSRLLGLKGNLRAKNKELDNLKNDLGDTRKGAAPTEEQKVKNARIKADLVSFFGRNSLASQVAVNAAYQAVVFAAGMKAAAEELSPADALGKSDLLKPLLAHCSLSPECARSDNSMSIREAIDGLASGHASVDAAGSIGSGREEMRNSRSQQRFLSERILDTERAVSEITGKIAMLESDLKSLRRIGSEIRRLKSNLDRRFSSSGAAAKPSATNKELSGQERHRPVQKDGKPE